MIIIRLSDQKTHYSLTHYLLFNPFIDSHLSITPCLTFKNLHQHLIQNAILNQHPNCPYHGPCHLYRSKEGSSRQRLHWRRCPWCRCRLCWRRRGRPPRRRRWPLRHPRAPPDGLFRLWSSMQLKHVLWASYWRQAQLHSWRPWQLSGRRCSFDLHGSRDRPHQ
jgi:hypothetical protein